MSTISKAAAMPERELIAFAKTDAISKAELGQLIDDLAQEARTRGESRAQAYTKFITEDPCGRELFAVHQSARGRDHAQEAAFQKIVAKAEKPAAGGDDPMAALNALAAAHQKAFPYLTAAQAFERASQSTEEGRQLFAAAKARDLKKNAA